MCYYIPIGELVYRISEVRETYEPIYIREVLNDGRLQDEHKMRAGGLHTR